MKKLLTSLVLGAMACAQMNWHRANSFEELRQENTPTILIENWRWEPIRFNIKSATQYDSLGTVPLKEKRCFEISQNGTVSVNFNYEKITYQTSWFNPKSYAGGHHLVIGRNPYEDVLSIEPSMRCNPDGNYTLF